MYTLNCANENHGITDNYRYIYNDIVVNKHTCILKNHLYYLSILHYGIVQPF